VTFRPVNMNNFDLSVTVSAIIEHDGRFLMIEEMASGAKVINQPAGHLEEHETFVEAVIREVKEETGINFTPTELVGIYRHRQPQIARTWLRVAFTGRVAGSVIPAPIDSAILAASWMSAEEIRTARRLHRSPQVLRSLEDYLAGQRAPLDLIVELPGDS